MDSRIRLASQPEDEVDGDDDLDLDAEAHHQPPMPHSSSESDEDDEEEDGPDDGNHTSHRRQSLTPMYVSDRLLSLDLV